MTMLRLMIGWCFIWCAVVNRAEAQTPCFTVTGEQILGRDLAHAVPALAKIAPNTPLAPSPLPGNARIFYLSELQSIGARFSITVHAPEEVCFRLATEVLNPDRVKEAMRNALGIPDARIDLVETSPGPVPAGAIEFARENLGVPASPDRQTPVPWRGDIVYSGNRRFPILTKVRITAPVSRLIAVEALRSGTPIKAGQVRVELIESFPLAGNGHVSVEETTGMVPLRPVAAGAEVRLDNLTRPNDVNRGDLVRVEVRFGAAHLQLTGRAESAGHVGDTIAVRNPDSSKVFNAMVQGVDKVLVERRDSE
jgi:flagella basal body P-ring formation protein FlgA